MSVTDRAEGRSDLPGVPDLPLPQDYQSYRWGWAPQGLATVRQLRAMGLRPARRSEPVSDITWRRGDRVAYLHRVDEAVPVQPPTAQQSAALDAAMRARKTCAECGTEAEYVLPTRFTGSPQCLDCLEDIDERGTDERADQDGAARRAGRDTDEEDDADGL